MKRILEIEDEYDFSLLGICCHAKDYRLSWEINNCVNLDVSKGDSLPADWESEEAIFSTSRFNDLDNNLQYALISNKVNGQFLVPEQPQLDFFLKISGSQHEDEIMNCKHALQKIDLVLTVLQVTPKSLKSRPNLVF